MDHPRQGPRVQFAFGEVVLRPLGDRFESDVLLLARGHDDFGEAGVLAFHDPQRIQPTTVRQVQIEQQDIERLFVQEPQRVLQAIGGRQRVVRDRRAGEQPLDLLPIDDIVLHDEDSQLVRRR